PGEWSVRWLETRWTCGAGTARPCCEKNKSPFGTARLGRPVRDYVRNDKAPFAGGFSDRSARARDDAHGPAAPRALVYLRARGLDDRGPVLDFRLDEHAKLGRCGLFTHGAQAGEGLLHVGVVLRLDDHGVQLVDDFLGRTGRGDEPEPGRHVEVI